ncbi:hypothetical protein CYMTET_34524 [Cymbomonas tetramitiformis]|uniref:Altered inheritance of mitochondria protein 24, mitochondrial n=1 Tax=Cymbomonas tetramitiformis TaxID=36881 RepID=A0AAE0FAZ2_9CHLO|nr:hypothetical protein CYMTET_34524 [Cymbomonas tetramitiformis]
MEKHQIAAPGMPVMASTGAVTDAENNFDPQGKFRIFKQGAYPAVEVSVTDTDALITQGGAMISMHANVDLSVTTHGGAAASCFRCCCAGETFFFTQFKAAPDAPKGVAYDVLIAPGIPGEVTMLHLDGNTNWRIQKASFLGCDPTVKIDTVMQSLMKGCCSGEGFFIMKASGAGRLVLNSFGSIIRYDLAAGEKRAVDNGALVAWTDSMDYTISRANKNSTMASFLSGEGFVNRFTGPGTVFVQTRNLKALADALIPYLPTQGNGGGGAGGSE